MTNLIEQVGKPHSCGGWILRGKNKLVFSTASKYIYCNKCGAYQLDDDPINHFPTGRDRGLNGAAWRDNQSRSPDVTGNN